MMLSEYQRVKSKMPPATEQLMVPHLARVDEALQPGLAALTWTSLNIETYLENAFAKISESVYLSFVSQFQELSSHCLLDNLLLICFYK